MNPPRTIGFPRMHKEAGEARDFLPGLIRRIAPLAGEVVVEQGIGAGMGIAESEYTAGVTNVRVDSNQACYAQDLVVQVRAPEDAELTRMRPGAILFSMLHFATHARRVARMQDLGLIPISMDSIVDDAGERLVEHLRGTSWNAVWAGFETLHKTYPALVSPHRNPVQVTIIGAGATGRFAAEAAAKYADEMEMWQHQIPGVVACLVDRSVTKNLDWLKRLLVQSDMLVDATARRNTTRCIISNHLVSHLPSHAVIVDLAADPYNTEIRPIQIKGIEGIPTGDLDKYEFMPDDPAFEELPEGVRAEHRRATVSCYSWPALKPLECMQRYGNQLEPLLQLLLHTSLDELSLHNPAHFERALYRGTLKYFLEHST